ncbi:hypothetical protein FO519_003081 [Halicephalobus sp. NKZ332]|nr:hypothetical protein FO519_003081 [Halicephalobus sp. NKZ332]
MTNIGHQFAGFIFGYFVLSGINVADRDSCYLMELMPIFGYNIGLFLMLALAIDRFLFVMFPDRRIICTIDQVYSGISDNSWMIVQLVVNLLIIMAYVYYWIYAREQRAEDVSLSRFALGLTTVTGVYVVAWVLTIFTVMADIIQVLNNLENAGIQSGFVLPATVILLLIPIGVFGNISIILALKTK